MTYVLLGIACFAAGALFAAWMLRGEDGFVAALRKLSGGPRPTVPK